MSQTFYATRRNGEFIINEPDSNYSRDALSADPTVAMASGTPVAIRAADGLVVPWNKGAAAGSGIEVFYGLLFNATYANADVTSIRVAVVARQAEVSSSYGRIPLPAGVLHADLVAACAAKGILVRD